MSYISPKIQGQFDTLSPELQEAILSRGVSLHNLYDLIAVLQQLIDDAEAAP